MISINFYCNIHAIELKLQIFLKYQIIKIRIFTMYTMTSIYDYVRRYESRETFGIWMLGAETNHVVTVNN